MPNTENKNTITNFVTGHIVLMPNEKFHPTEGRLGVFKEHIKMFDAISGKRINNVLFKTIRVPESAIIKQDDIKFAYKKTPDAHYVELVA